MNQNDKIYSQYIQIKLHMQNREDLYQKLNSAYAKISIEVKSFLQNDPKVEREDTCRGMLTLLEQIKSILKQVNSFSTEERARNYVVTYNAVNYILNITEHLRKSNYAYEMTERLAEAIKSMQGNIILQDVKYMDKITQLYLKLAKLYEEGQNYQQALILLENATKQYKDLKAIHELDQPVPLHVQSILNNNIKIIKVFYIKYNIQAGILTPAEWKKKVDEQFGEDLQAKLFCLIESLKTETKKNSNIFVKNMKSYKESLLTNGYEMIKVHIETLSKGLTQQKDKIEREVNFKTGTLNATQVQINDQIKKRRQVEQKYIKESQIKKASDLFPLEYHSEMIHYALQIKNSKILTELIQCAIIRIECRRIQVPYVNDIMIIVSNSPYPNVPNGYTKTPVDLNEANMRKELTKLRKSGKKAPEDQVLKQPASSAPTGKEEKKDNKKGGKQPEKQAEKKQNDLNREPSQWQLNQIKHKYVFMMIKKSMNPESALYDLGVVLGNEEKGPVGYADNRRIIVPYIQQNMKILQSEVSQHTGVKQLTGMVPYVILYHSRNSLQDENEKKTIITDVSPLIGKNPMIPAKWGYKKLNLDLRQVPSQYIKAPNHDYVYLTYKTDELFHISQRHVQIIKAFNDLESTYAQKKGSSNEQEKYIELQLNYDLQKLNFFFETLQESLRGELGQQYYKQRTDFLTNLTLQIYTKYLKNPLLQFDYMRQQRLNEQIIDYDYNSYKNIIQLVNPIFMKGLKILNLIMLNNQKSDLLLLSKLNLQLGKLLQEARFYKIAAQNIKICLNRLRQYRDEYLSKGVQGKNDKLLPFAITCSNLKIKSMMLSMKKRFDEQRRYLQKVLRMKERLSNGTKPLSHEQLQEQQKQFVHYRKKDQFDDLVDKIQPKHEQVYAIVYALELDLLNLYFRVSLKRGEEISRLENSKNDMTYGVKNSQLEGLAASLKQKLTLGEGPTQTKNIHNLAELQNTLIKANKLPAPKPKLQKIQSKLIAQNYKNPYASALLMLNLAALNSSNNDKKYYLSESLNYILKSIQIQKQLTQKSIQNSIFIFSGLWDNKIKQQQNSQKIYPFRDLYNNVWQEATEVPQPPILINKNSSSIHLKLPPFVALKVNEKKQIKYMSVYGKPSANGVDVSLNCIDLQGTGIRKQIGKTVKVSALQANNLYCFAAAGIDHNQQTTRIGKTGQDIGTYNPFSIPMLASYLAKVSYQISEFQISQKAAQIILNQYCNQPKYLTNDQRIQNVHFYTINEQALAGVSLFQLKFIAEAIYVAALCQRRKLNEAKEHQSNKPKIIFQEKEKLITNLLMLSSALSPSLSSPNISIPFIIPENEVLMRAISINTIPQKWMNPKIRKVGIAVMQKLLKWGIQNNQINLARRLVYKWNQRKYLILGKMIQVQQKKQIKKGAKDTKEPEAKMIDKYCRIMIEKSPYLMDAFEDSMTTISEEYYDYVSIFVEKAKEQIGNLSQYVDNPPEELQLINNHLGSKLQLIEYLKEPLQSIKKITTTSPYYLEYNSRILKKGMQIANDAEIKLLLVKSQELDIPDVTEEIKLSKEIYQLMFSAIRDDISWSPCSKKELILIQEKTGKDLKKAIEIFQKWEIKKVELVNKTRKNIALSNKHKDYDYLNMWISQLNHLKAQIVVMSNCNEFTVKRKIRVRYDKIENMSIDDLFKKQTEVNVLEDKSYSYSEDQIKKLTQILNYLAQSVYAAMVIQNWIKVETILKFLCNVLGYIQITPFYHKGSSLWTYFTFISLCVIEMLNNIRRNGQTQFKKRYNSKLMNTEISNIKEKLQLGDFKSEQLIEEFIPEYYLPDLDPSTTKEFWFTKSKLIDIEAISSIIAYTVNTLRLENKHNLVINVVREFCNITQHCFSLVLLPFMTNSQSKLLEEVQSMISKENSQLNEVQMVYNVEKEKKGKKRAAMLSGQKMQFELVYEQKNTKLKESLNLLYEQKNFILMQTKKSNKIKEQISRDTNKQVLAQKEQKKYASEFGQHYEQMYRQYGQQAKHVKKSKNLIKDIINQYDKIYDELRNSKTSKDTLAEIQNRNDVGNLWFASGNIDKAYQFWNDSLATIFKKVNPINNYLQILNDNKPYLVNIIGSKEIIVALSLLYKISSFAASNKLNIQRLCSHFACNLAFSLFQTNLEYPQTYEMHKDFRIKDFPARQIFSDDTLINLNQLLSTLEYFIVRNIYEQNSLSALPLASFFQYIATDVVKNAELSIRAKILKSLCLSESGYISQSIRYLTKVSNQKDLPILWLQSSDYLKKEKGINWVQDGLQYSNGQFWTNADNKTVIQDLKKLTLKAESVPVYKVLNPILFTYSKAMILYKIYENEICKDEALNDQRLINLNEAESIMRQCLKKLSNLEQSYQLLQEYQGNVLNFKQNEVSDDLKKLTELSKTKLNDFMKKSGFDDASIKIFQREESNSLKRIFRLQFMCKIRFSIYKISQSRNLYSNCYFILKNGVSNMHRYAIGARLCQTGYDPEIKVNPLANVPVGGKKDDKKAGKKEEEAPQVSQAQPIDIQKEKELRAKNQAKTSRNTLNSYWHIKLLHEIGKILFKQNNFRQSIKLFQTILTYSTKYQDEFFSLISKSYICRSKLRLGDFKLEEFKDIIVKLEANSCYQMNYFNLVMDLGELLAGQKISLEYLRKGKAVIESLWSKYGMKSILNGLSCPPPVRNYFSKEELNAEQEELIKKKKKGQKKAGKDDKKAAKKQDPKKKKEQSKLEYKVTPLSKLTDTNLLQDQKQKLIFGQYSITPHPNYRRNNIYQSFPLLYIKAYIRLLQEQISQKENKEFLSQIPYLLKLIQIVETYAHSTEHFKINLYYIIGKINKNIFVDHLKDLIKNTPKVYAHFIKYPFEDLPLNRILVNIPAYSEFLLNNRKYLIEAKVHLKKSLTAIENSTIFYERNLSIDEIAWQYADNQCLLAQYIGRQKPKYYPEDQIQVNQEQSKLQMLNNIFQAFNFLDYSIKLKNNKFQLSRNYLQIGGKGIDANAKIDEDITSDILQMDKLNKKVYPSFLTQIYKGKTALSGTDIITYMFKIYREAEIMTFTNNQYQNILYKCNRILSKSLTGYKEKYVFASLDVVLKKSIKDKFIENEAIIVKSLKGQDSETFLYVLGQQNQADQIVYGRIIIQLHRLSTLVEDILILTTKTGISDKKSQSVKNRDYILHKKEFKRILHEISLRFGNEKVDDNIKALPEEQLVQITTQNLKTINKMLDSNGYNNKNKEVNKYLRYLHKIKYQTP